MAPGKLITIEGIDGAGKTTLAVGLVDALQARGIDAILLRDPGGVPVAERVRELVKDREATIGSRAETLLYAAARAQLVEEAIAPLLARGAIVILDRFVDSSLAYQGAGRELGVEPVAAINAFATAGIRADLTLLLDVEPATGRSRLRQRSVTPDRLERMGDDFVARVVAAYRDLAGAEPDRFRTLDGAREPSAVLDDALTAVKNLVARAD
jgi:dTMP kinase